MTHSRRTFLQQGLASTAGLSLFPSAIIATHDHFTSPARFINLRRPPDSLLVQSDSGSTPMVSAGEGRWTQGDIVLRAASGPAGLAVVALAAATPVRRFRLRWHARVANDARVLGDAWERGYGDLEWRGIVPDRVMPWYFAMTTAGVTHTYGVRTGANAFCFWQVDSDGVSLWADVRSGGVGVRLDGRELEICTVVSRAGRAGESPFTALHAFCRQMCPARRAPSAPVYGSNDWYWAYGKNNEASVLSDAARIVELSPTGANRPFAVIDDGWQPGRGATDSGSGYWDRGNDKFPDMARLANGIRERGARPGIWIRPLEAPTDAPAGWRLSRSAETLDPTVPEVNHRVAEDIRRLRQWGYELIKHDYSTWDIFGRWGFQMGSAMTKDGWTFAEGQRRTTAEIVTELYRTIRTAADDGLVIGCNTVSHLSAGIFEICRIGDDTSGTEWARTRKMGVNTLAFRGVQHGAFYTADADCVGVTTEQPWSLNRQWLDLLARSGTMLMVSLASDALGTEQRRDLKAALALAARPQALAEPLDWTTTIYPTRWRLMGRPVTYDWVGPDGAEL
jgi:alpha-galactosidase